MTQPATVIAGSVVVSDEALLITDLIETDADVIEFVRQADDAVEATRKCLRIGARSIRAASATIDAETVATRFDALSDDFSARVEGAVVQVAAITSGLLDAESGALTSALADHHAKLAELLDSNFDPQSKVSVMAKIEEIVAEALGRQSEAIKKVISLDSADGPLHVLKTEILAGFSAPVAELTTQMRELSEKVAVNAAVAPVIEITTAKGFAFEDVLHDRVATIAANHGDTAEKAGTEIGVSGSKKGDEVVVINSDDTFGAERRFVLEAKTRRMSARDTYTELDAAAENRAAAAAIAVFDDQSKAPSSVPFQYSDNKAIAVLDDDPSALRLAYMWARWVVRRDNQIEASDSLDHERIADLIECGQRAIERHNTIKRSHTQARKAIDQAANQVQTMIDEIESTLTNLEAELSFASDQEMHRAAS